VFLTEKWLIEQARLDPLWFFFYVSGLEPPMHFRIWYSMMFNFVDPAMYRLNFLSPRESSKSTAVIYGMAWFIARFPHLTNAIATVSAAQAEKRLAMLNEIIEINQRFRNVFPWIHIDHRQRNTVSQFSVYADAIFRPIENKVDPISYSTWRAIVSRFGSPKDPTINTGGILTSGLIGSRWSGIFMMDDIIDHTTLSDDSQDDIMNVIMGTFIPSLQPGAKGINIGTRWRPDDVPYRLKNNPSWRTVEIQAMRQGEDGQVRSYWPNYWPVQRILDKKEEMQNDALFEIMYMNNPTGLASAKFTQAGLANPLPKLLPVFTHLFVGTDFAQGMKAQHDFNVFTAIGVDAAVRLYILKMIRFKGMPDTIIQTLIDFSRSVLTEYARLSGIIIEKVGFQTNFGFDLSQKAPELPVGFQPLVGDKDHRVSLLATKSNRLEVFYNQEDDNHKVLEGEALNFNADRGHDDTLDSISVVLLHIIANVVVARTHHIKPKYAI
jgi:predicted phage terminase large subunit-like protein